MSVLEHHDVRRPPHFPSPESRRGTSTEQVANRSPRHDYVLRTDTGWFLTPAPPVAMSLRPETGRGKRPGEPARSGNSGPPLLAGEGPGEGSLGRPHPPSHPADHR